MPPEKDRATAAENLHKKFVNIGLAVPEICSLTDRRTDRQTDKLIAILRSPTGAQ